MAFEYPAEFQGSPSYLATPAGPIPYWTRPYTFRERYTANAGGTSGVGLFVHGYDAADFLRYAHGFTEFSGSNLTRNLPLQSPYTAADGRAQFLADLSLEALGPHSADPFFDNWAAYAWIGYKAEFATLPYQTLNEVEVPYSTGAPGVKDELWRYVTRTMKHNNREREVKEHQLETDDGEDIPEGAWIIDQATDWLYTWYQVPLEHYPRTAIQECTGKINDADFDHDAPEGQRFAAGQLHFRGVANEMQPYRGPDGGLYYDLVYHFAYRFLGWNYYVRPDGTDIGWRFRPPFESERPFKEADFNTLFIPQA